MAYPPPLPPLRRNISRSLDNISEVVAKYEKKRAPALPPRPLPRKPPARQPDPEYDVVGVLRKKIEDDTVSISSTRSEFQSVYDLQTFCKEMKLPRAIEVTDGFCGPTEDIPVGYQLMIYFQKSTSVVQAKDLLDSVYNIPLNSSLQFAPIDDLHLKPKAGDYSGFHYDSIEEMLQERPSLPKVVRAKGSFTKGKHSINANDILFPKKIDKSTLGSKVTGLLCAKLGGDEVKLPLECACGFSTATEDTRLHLLEYIEYVNQFPVKVCIVGIDNYVQSGMPKTLILVGKHQLETLVARSLHCDTEIVTEIPMDVPIRVRCLDLADEKSEQARVKKVYETFSTAKVSNIYSLAKTNAQYKAQQQFYVNVQKENDSKYYDIKAPENVGNLDTLQNETAQSSPKPSRHRMFKTHLLKNRSQSVGDGDSIENDDAGSPVTKHKLFKGSRSSGKHKGQSTSDGGNDEADANLKQEFANLAESLKVEIKTEIKLELESSVREEIRKLRVDNAHCLQQLARINERIEQLQKQNKSTTLSKTIPKSNDKPSTGWSSKSDSFEEIYKLSAEDNIRFLQSLDHLQILQLLDGMKLEKHKAEFKSSFVDGQLLATLSHTELVELKVNSSLHQRKLLNIIQGKESAKKYLLLSQENPYV